MRKYMPVLVVLVVLFALTATVSAADADDTQQQTDSQNISQNQVSTQTVAKTTETSKVKESTSEEAGTNEGDDCCSAIIQGYSNDSTISFRRDSEEYVTLNVTHNTTVIKQYKDTNTSFFHVIVTNNGWLVGNGGSDSSEINLAIEKQVMNIINTNELTDETFSKIISIKSKGALGHTVIKAPNGTYQLFIKRYNETYSESGVLKSGEFLSVSNDPKYFIKGKYQNYTNSTWFIESSKIIAAKNPYGSLRRDIVTYYYKRTGLTSNVRIYATNDDGSYVNKKTAKYYDNIRTNTSFISGNKIANLSGWTTVDNINFTIKPKTYVTAENITTNTKQVELTAKVVDEFGNPLNYGFVSVSVNSKSVKYENRSAIYANVKNGTATINYTIPNLWKYKNYTYVFRYYGKTRYESTYGDKAIISVANVVKVKTAHASTTKYNTSLTVAVKVRYASNSSLVENGKVIFKINGKTIKNSDGTTLTVNVINGTAKCKIPLDEKYSAKKFKLNVVYVNGVQRGEKNSTFQVTKIATKLLSAKATYNSTKNTVKITGKLVDSTTNKKIKFASYTGVKINGLTLKYDNGTTRTFNITNGVIKFTFKLPTNYRKGNHTITLLIPELRETLSIRQNITLTIA